MFASPFRWGVLVEESGKEIWERNMEEKSARGGLAVESWQWDPSCGLLAVEIRMVVESWLRRPGNGILGVGSWLGVLPESMAGES